MILILIQSYDEHKLKGQTKDKFSYLEKKFKRHITHESQKLTEYNDSGSF